MLNSSVLDVAIGAIFGFLAVSLMTSAIVEAFNSFLQLRAKSLLTGIKNIVNDPNFTGLAKTLYEHAAINPRAPAASVAAGAVAKPLANLPSYIDRAQFATALMDITGLSAASANAGAQIPGPDAVAAFQAALNQNLAAVQNPQIKALLEGIVQRAKGDATVIQKALADWFDGAMDRVGGAFKRLTQVLSVVIALVISVVLNVDTVHIVTALWQQPALVANLKLDNVAPAAAGADGATPNAGAALAAETLMQANLPIGWPGGNLFQVLDKNQKPAAFWTCEPVLPVLLGWLLTAFATLFGAPFWFDLLQSAVRLKGTGPSPLEKVKGTAASA
jgi:hypothetical protein